MADYVDPFKAFVATGSPRALGVDLSEGEGPPMKWLVRLMVRLRLWNLEVDNRRIEVRPRWGAKWLLAWMLREHVVDSAHHAPLCPANHWHRTRLVLRGCSCGARY